ncbi:ABC transporter ATP-binding protein [Brevibacillus dissolubilis]|uniref:ABC transporter ATP-binding protein n=1 Tax=Brevibacillus dissolubilis TaxID=1844116 RepID=UPI0011165D8B|nr:ABC transporter ATP-binding protein [Brevibacillus dissolubilis]
MSSSDTVISIRNVSKTYKLFQHPLARLKDFFVQKGTVKEFTALEPISLDIKRGSAVGLIGRNGSGKSTLLQMIAGVLAPTTGTIEVKGRVSALLELGSGFSPEFTGRENVFLNASIMGIPRKEMEARFDEIVSFADIGDFIDRPVKTYSSGMFVRLAFAVATLVDPDILIVDEALAVGDEKFQRKCYNHLETMRKKGCTILFVSHSMPTVQQICTDVYLLDKSKLIAHGEPKKVIDMYHKLLYSGENDYLKIMNEKKQATKKAEASTPTKKEEASAVTAEGETAATSNTATEETGTGLAWFDTVQLLDADGQESFVYGVGDQMNIRCVLKSKADCEDILLGMKIVTTQGVEVFGTSNKYKNQTISVYKDQPLEVTFQIDLSLVRGTYHISVAMAQKAGSEDMVYLDKKTDHFTFRVEENPINGTGIANLATQILLKE